jgi:hypothetical protein
MFHGLIVVVFFVALGAAASMASEQYFVSFGFVGSLKGQELLPNNIYEYDSADDVASLFLDGNAAGLNNTINGIDVLPSGNLLLSFGFSVNNGDDALLASNIYEYDPTNGVTTVFLDGSEAGLASTINGIDALPSGNLLLTFGFNGTSGGQEFVTNSIYEYDPVNDSATLFFDGGAAGLTSSIDGIDVLPSGSFLLSFGRVGSIGGQELLPNNIYEYNPATGVATVFLDGNDVELDSVVSAIASITLVPEPSSLLLAVMAAMAAAVAAHRHNGVQ